MAIWIVKNSGKISYGIKRYLCDTLEDLPYSENGEVVIPGCKAYVVSEKKTYMMGSDEEWHEINEGSGSGASSMSQLTDVDLTNLEDGQVLKYDEDTQTWKPGDDASATSLGNLDDVDLTNLQNGQVIRFDSQTETWLATNIPLVLYGISNPTSNIGEDGQLYAKYGPIEGEENVVVTLEHPFFGGEDSTLYVKILQDGQEIYTETSTLNHEKVTTTFTTLGGTVCAFEHEGGSYYSTASYNFKVQNTIFVLTGEAGQGIYTWNLESDPINITLGNKIVGLYLKINDTWTPQIVPDELADLADDATHRTVTDVEKATWNNKTSTTELTQEQYDALPSETKNLPIIYQISDKGYFFYKGKQFRSSRELTQAEFDALSTSEKNNGTEYLITDATTSIGDIDDVDLSNPADGQIIKYDATNQTWVNADDEGGTELPVPTTADIGKVIEVISDGEGGAEYSLISKPDPVVYIGTLGTGGTAESLPTVGPENNGWEYKVITAGTYAGKTAKVGDMFISNGIIWDLIPSGDEKEPIQLSDTLIAGQTSITFQDARITGTSCIDVYAEAWYTGFTQSDGEATLTFPAQSTDMLVQIMVAN